MVLVEAVQLSASFSLLPLKITSHHPSPSVMDLLKTVLKVENHTKEPLNIRGIFARCGEMYVCGARFCSVIKILLLNRPS